MIRPITLICFLLACGSGLYLYQSKHRVAVLDRQIEATVHTTEQLREQTRVLHAEWTLQNDPQRLQALADQFLTLKPVAPSQFTSMADLDTRLPPVAAPPPPPAPTPAEPPAVPVVQAPVAPVTTMADTRPAPPPPVVHPAPSSPKPVAVAAAAPPPRPVDAPPRPVEHRPPPRPVFAEAQPPLRLSPPIARPIVMAAAPRSVVVQSPPALTGSALGMAHTGAMALPAPQPISASQWVSNGGNGGG